MKKIKIWTALLLVTLAGCDDFVEVDTPGSQLIGATVFEDTNTAEAAIADVYAAIRDFGVLSGQGLGSGYNLGLYADELTYYGSSTSPEYTNTLLGSSSTAASLWSASYKQLYSTNAIIEGVNASASLSQEYRSKLKGEALFIRALIHFYLVNLFGDIPYCTTTDYAITSKIARLDTAEVYQYILADLQQAIELLPADYPTPERCRANKAVARFLLSRVYLYHGDWEKAASQATMLIEDPAYPLDTNLQDSFVKDAPSTIWQLIPKLSGNNTYEASLYTFTSGPPPLVSLSNGLVDSFESNDQRKNNWVATITEGNTSWYHAYKYKLNTNTGTSMEYSIVFRICEQYLIRAEVRTMLRDLQGAAEDLNKVRTRAGLSVLEPSSSEAMMEAILQERRVELFTEYGHRFFDLKRTGKLNQVLGPLKPGWDNNDRLWPVPNNEILLNPNLLPQNDGY